MLFAAVDTIAAGIGQDTGGSRVAAGAAAGAAAAATADADKGGIYNAHGRYRQHYGDNATSLVNAEHKSYDWDLP
ncbi:hypothetical protein CFO_g1969 [Ceratocystis platani]|uniref:Uncharacterized protein n=1 Tax=Ceratocystis fimbriata f. sp. platani TaxID=88771 RepID=A0A0F8B5B4_CERFI|nr:hypothetical protein CFO_g1969 [Ceratocystis platani]